MWDYVPRFDSTSVVEFKKVLSPLPKNAEIGLYIKYCKAAFLGSRRPSRAWRLFRPETARNHDPLIPELTISECRTAAYVRTGKREQKLYKYAVDPWHWKWHGGRRWWWIGGGGGGGGDGNGVLRAYRIGFNVKRIQITIFNIIFLFLINSTFKKNFDKIYLAWSF